MNVTKRALTGLLLSYGMHLAHAGFDASVSVTAVQIAPNGNVYFQASGVNVSPYCASGWAGLNMYVPKDHPDYMQYYVMLMTALTKSKKVYVANLDLGNTGAAPCDITKTGFGLMLLAQ